MSRLSCAEMMGIVARLEAAAPAPWAYDPTRSVVHGAGRAIAWFGALPPTPQDMANAEFVVCAREDMQALVATVEGLARELAGYAAHKPPAALCAWCGAQGRQVADHGAACPVRRAAALLGVSSLSESPLGVSPLGVSPLGA
ncbi:MAG TPA: hypothetical protein VGR57_05795 [Ktedonobacterales bacterium]|nr:hypothetical protein [Ktedonobacterales bacterium]